MATYIKGNITYTPVVEQINRKFTVKKNVCVANKKVGPVTLETANFMGGATRISRRNGLGTVRKNYFFYRENASILEPTSSQLDIRAKFTAARAWAAAAVKDLGALAHNQEVYKYLGEHSNSGLLYLSNARGYTFKGLHFAWAMAALQNDAELPTNHQLPTPSGMA